MTDLTPESTFPFLILQIFTVSLSCDVIVLRQCVFSQSIIFYKSNIEQPKSHIWLKHRDSCAVTKFGLWTPSRAQGLLEKLKNKLQKLVLNLD